MNRFKSWLPALEIYLPVRIMASAVAFLAHSGIPSQATVSAGNYTKPMYPDWIESLFGVWERSDALWYFHLARDGYQGSSDSAFLPLYPILIRIVHFFTRLPWIFSGLFVSNLAFLFAIKGFLSLVEDEFDLPTAKKSCWLMVLFPGSFFFLAPYTESLFLALSIYTFLWARQSKWARASICAFFLALTRNLGSVILLPLAIELFLQVRAKKSRLGSALWLGLVPLASSCIFLFYKMTTGDPLSWIHSQDNWGRVSQMPWKTLWDGIIQSIDYFANPPGAVYVFESLSTFAAAFLLFYSLFRRTVAIPYLLFGFCLLIPPLCAPYPGRMLMSTTRFTAVIFPIFVILGRWIEKSPERKIFNQIIQCVFAGCYSLAVTLYVCNQNMF